MKIWQLCSTERQSILTGLTIIFLAGFNYTVPAAHNSTQNPELQQLAQRIETDPQLLPGQWSCTAIDTETGALLLQVNAQKSLAPASCLKLVTSAAALNLLGENYRFETRLEYDGQLDSTGQLNGNLFVVGSGDPTLGSSRIDSVLNSGQLMQAWADTLYHFGIRAMNGNLFADANYLDQITIPDNWMWVDLGNYYGAGTSGLCINENSCKITFKPAPIIGQATTLVRVEPAIPGVNWVNLVTTGNIGSGDNAYIYAAPNSNLREIRGTIPAGVAEFSIKGALPDPALSCVQTLLQALQARSISVTGTAQISGVEARTGNPSTPRQVVSRTLSPRLKDIVFWLNKKSINLYAEQLLKVLGKKFENEGSYAAGSKVLEKFLQAQQIPLTGLFLHDGSGLSRYNGISTGQLTQLLVKMVTMDCFPAFYRSLPIAGEPTDNGTIR
ncbi:D-alanyl-D-alanine carboxypeptidase/D-alanyl-D-alanine-endopeptidase, partial [candidate division KSB1 bacterium]|nr:D-alanyl-D-alanine carboxypeptidase/D-alanyl-D-alanine-endopeptidase [candidate division KSB1 bacterium]